jgi:hypothetical protein
VLRVLADIWLGMCAGIEDDVEIRSVGFLPKPAIADVPTSRSKMVAIEEKWERWSGIWVDDEKGVKVALKGVGTFGQSK